MNFNLMMGAIGYIGGGTVLLNKAQQLGYPFWLTVVGALLWALAVLCAVWGLLGAMHERRSGRQ
jgi:hypothetical protein